MIKQVRNDRWKEALKNMFMSRDQINDRELEKESLELGVKRAQDCKRGERTTVHGTVKKVSFRPQGSVPIYEVVISDGTGLVRLAFLGRRYIAGIDPGRHMSATGLIQDRKGELVMMNPRYELNG